MVLLCGLALAIMVAILEFCWNSRKNAMNDRQSLCSEMAEELRFAMRCHGSRQKPALRRSCSRCSPEGTYVPAAVDSFPPVVSSVSGNDHTIGYSTSDSVSSSKFHHLSLLVVLVSHSSNFHHWPLLVALVLH